MLTTTAATAIALLSVAVFVLLICLIVVVVVLSSHLRRNAHLWRIQNKVNQSQCSANRHMHDWQSATTEVLRRLANGERV